MEIYYEKNSKKYGPVPEVEIISMLERGELSDDSRAWHVGCSSWQTLRHLPALSTYFNLKDQPKAPVESGANEDKTVEPSPKGEEESNSEVVYLASPLARLLARMVDLMLYALGYAWLMVHCFDKFEQWLFLAPVVWLPAILPEALFLTLWQTTPGKWLVGLRVTAHDGTPLPFLRALRRAFYVIFFGMGMVTTMFSPLMMALSAWYTSKFGRVAPWDIGLGTVSEELKPLNAVRVVLCLMVIVLVLNVTAQVLEPWADQIQAALKIEG